ncbi:hypothetical protein RI367_000908 [Sorochytrium milnesiophthora]
MVEKDNYKWRQSLGYQAQIPKFLQKIIATTEAVLERKYGDLEDERPTVVIDDTVHTTTSTRELEDYLQRNPELANANADPPPLGGSADDAQEPVLPASKDGKLLFRKPKSTATSKGSVNSSDKSDTQALKDAVREMTGKRRSDSRSDASNQAATKPKKLKKQRPQQSLLSFNDDGEGDG